MNEPKKSANPAINDDDTELPAGGPTAPSSADDKAGKGPETGGYDDHPPDEAPSNEKGGYGTG